MTGLFLPERSFREGGKESSSFCLHNNDDMRVIVDVQMKIDSIQTVEFIDNSRFHDLLRSESLDGLSQKLLGGVLSSYHISVEDIVIFRLFQLMFKNISLLRKII